MTKFDKKYGTVHGFPFTVEIAPLPKMSPPWRMLMMPFFRSQGMRHIVRYDGDTVVGVSFVRAQDAIKFDEFITPYIQEGLLNSIKAVTSDQQVVQDVIDAPVHRVFEIDTGNLTVEQVQTKIEELKEEIETKRVPDVEIMLDNTQKVPNEETKQAMIETEEIIKEIKTRGRKKKAS